MPPELIEKLSSSPYRYFRFLAQPFAQRVCRSFRDERWNLPTVLVHGDAHLEQFTYTQRAHGLGDFDQAALGPAVVDLVRFGSSMHLACHQAQWECDADRAVGVFLDAYGQGLESPHEEAKAPKIVARLRAKRPEDKRAFLEWADGLMTPLSAKLEQEMRNEYQQVVAFLMEVDPGRDEQFYSVVRLGSLTLGVGSALDLKFLFRIRGPSDDPLDDVILEAKEQTPPRDIECVSSAPSGGMLRPLVATVQLGRWTPDILAYVRLPQQGDRPRHIWIQSWQVGRGELSTEDVTEQADLEEVAHDAGLQLGQAASKLVPAALVNHHRVISRQSLQVVAGRVHELSRSLAVEIVAAWEQYRSS